MTCLKLAPSGSSEKNIRLNLGPSSKTFTSTISREKLPPSVTVTGGPALTWISLL